MRGFAVRKERKGFARQRDHTAGLAMRVMRTNETETSEGRTGSRPGPGSSRASSSVGMVRNENTT